MVDFDLPPIGALMKGCSGCDALESRTVPCRALKADEDHKSCG